jgi:hypothetical protein
MIRFGPPVEAAANKPTSGSILRQRVFHGFHYRFASGCGARNRIDIGRLPFYDFRDDTLRPFGMSGISIVQNFNLIDFMAFYGCFDRVVEPAVGEGSHICSILNVGDIRVLDSHVAHPDHFLGCAPEKDNQDSQ